MNDLEKWFQTANNESLLEKEHLHEFQYVYCIYTYFYLDASTYSIFMAWGGIQVCKIGHLRQL